MTALRPLLPVAAAAWLAVTSGCADGPAATGSGDGPGPGDEGDPLPVDVRVPPGFRVSVFADGLPGVRTLKIGPDGALWAVRSQAGELLRFELDADGGAAGAPEVVADDLRQPYGLAFRDGAVYVGETHQVVRLTGSGLSTREVVVPDLPTGGHWTRELAFGADGWLYLSVGSSCNLCEETDPRRAAVVRYRPDGSGEEVVARGVRNAAGLAVHPETGVVWASQNERDHLGDDLPPEEINLLEAPGGAVEHFGWPYCYGAGIPNPEYDDLDRCGGTLPPALEMQAHSAPLGMVFYEGEQFPEEYRGDLFLAFHGSWNRSERTGYELVRVRVGAGGRPAAVEPFATGWLRPDGSVEGRPVYPAVGPDGSLYLSDDGAGRIWRIRYGS